MSNRAAYLTGPKANPLSVSDAAIPTPDAHEVVIQSKAAAINPVDWKVQDYGLFYESADYPTVLGTDAAGIVHAVGSGVTNFRPGDRVLAHLDGLANKKASNGGFQLYPKTNQAFVAKLPDSVSFVEGAVLPLALSTAAAGLFQKEYLALPHPAKDAQRTGDVLLIWGGSSSVGSTAIQLASAAGVEVATTASPRNNDYVKSLGATHVFDHSSSSVVEDIVKALQGKKFLGVYDAISEEATIKKSAEVASKLDGKKFVATVLPPPEKGLPEDVKANGLFALTIAGNDVGPAVWGKYVPQALADGSLKPKPDPLVVGKGLESVQEGLNKNKAGVSAKKVVIDLS